MTTDGWKDRFWSKAIRVESGCLEWAGSIDPYGYGRAFDSVLKQRVKAHRLAYELAVGPIPQGLQIDHNKEAVMRYQQRKLAELSGVSR